MQKCDIAVIGGGAGGLVVASVAAQLGLDVALIEKEKQLGGDCLHYGCVPSKALLRSSHVAHLVRHAADFGVQVSPAQSDNYQSDIHKVNQFIANAVDTIQPHDSHERFESFGCDIYTGVARFLDAHRLQVGGDELRARRVVIATGSSAWIPPIDGFDGISYLTNEHMYSLDKIPQHLLILGAGPIGVEMAQAYVRHGSRVTLIELAERVLPRADVDISRVLREQLTADGVSVMTGIVVEHVSQQGDTIRLELQGEQAVEGDRLLVAIGRRPVVAGMDLEKAGVHYSEQGIKVNSKMQTNKRHIYACGDVTGLMPLTHVAEQQAGVIIANAVFRIPKKMSYRVIPSVVYTDPECAQVGMMPEEVAEDKHASIVRFEMNDLDRAIAENTTQGFIKLVVRKGRIAGAHIIGPHAGEVIHELVLAIQENMKLSKVTAMVHAYPTFSQINRRAASQYYRSSLFSAKTRKLVKLINRWLP